MTKYSGGEKDFLGFADLKLIEADNGKNDNSIVTIVESGYIKVVFLLESGLTHSRIVGPNESFNSPNCITMFRLSENIKLNTVDKTDPTNASFLLRFQAQYLLKNQGLIGIWSQSYSLKNRLAENLISLFSDYGVKNNNCVHLPFRLTDAVLGELNNVERVSVARIKNEVQDKLGFWIDENKKYKITQDRLLELAKKLILD
jgi:hypothetical protein